MPWIREWQPNSVFLPGESPWTERPCGLQSMGSQRVRHDWATKHSTHRKYWYIWSKKEAQLPDWKEYCSFRKKDCRVEKWKSICSKRGINLNGYVHLYYHSWIHSSNVHYLSILSNNNCFQSTFYFSFSLKDKI